MATEILKRYRLMNPHGWTLVYIPITDHVQVEWWYKGALVGINTVTVVEARRHYASQLRDGMVPSEKF